MGFFITPVLLVALDPSTLLAIGRFKSSNFFFIPELTGVAGFFGLIGDFFYTTFVGVMIKAF
jgi:hypothetical protein